jgi:methionyl aminopeptidase
VDSARTVAIGETDKASKKLLEVTKNALLKGIEFLCHEKPIGDYTKFVQSYVENNGMFVFEETGGHGIGEDFHEDPYVPNCGKISKNIILKEGMTLAVEPMVNFGTKKTRIMPDEWTIVTDDGSRSAHFEHTVVITKNGPKILTI